MTFSCNLLEGGGAYRYETDHFMGDPTVHLNIHCLKHKYVKKNNQTIERYLANSSSGYEMSSSFSIIIE